MIECSNCDGKGGWVIADSWSPGCDDTEDTETCTDCQGTGNAICEFCDRAATHSTSEKIGEKIFFTLTCDSCFQNVQKEQSA